MSHRASSLPGATPFDEASCAPRHEVTKARGITRPKYPLYIPIYLTDPCSSSCLRVSLFPNGPRTSAPPPAKTNPDLDIRLRGERIAIHALIDIKSSLSGKVARDDFYLVAGRTGSLLADRHDCRRVQPDAQSQADNVQLTRSALLTGITGQDGSYLTELLLSKGYTVHGLVRRNSSIQRTRLDPLFFDKEIYNNKLFLHYADLDDVTTIRRILCKTEPDELYHLAGQSHVGASFEIPESTCQFTAMGTLRLLEIVRDLPKQPRFLHISSSEIFGRPDDSPQNERTPMRPVSPYGVAKAFATNMTTLYRDSFDLFACNAIAYNHESPRRGESFVTRKISRAAASISLGLQNRLKMGGLDARRDWGYAPEYVDAMWRMLQQDEPDDFVLATGKSHSVEDFLQTAFEAVDLDWKQYYEPDPRFMRAAEPSRLVGDPTKAEQQLGWKAEFDLARLVSEMITADLDLLRSMKTPRTKPQV